MLFIITTPTKKCNLLGENILTFLEIFFSSSQIMNFVLKYVQKSGGFMLKTCDIIDEKNKILRQVSEEVTIPLTKEDKKNIKLMEEYLVNSQIEELAEKYDLRPGMGMSAVQIGVLKRYIVIVMEVTTEDDDEQVFDTYVVINPKIVSNSEEKIYVEDGEGCLSINRETTGIVPRFARCTVEGYDMDGKKIRIRAREELSIAFQHEIDHLNGILFIDHIDPKDPFKGKDIYRPI